MRRSSKSFLFPDVNVWVALSYEAHTHHRSALDWFQSVGADATLCFCRITQISYLRLLTTAAMMGREVLSQSAAWATFDEWMQSGRVLFLDEPPGLEIAFRRLSQASRPSPKDWADAYLVAFASISGLLLVTFDQSLRSKATDVLILGA